MYLFIPLAAQLYQAAETCFKYFLEALRGISDSEQHEPGCMHNFSRT